MGRGVSAMVRGLKAAGEMVATALFVWRPADTPADAAVFTRDRTGIDAMVCGVLAGSGVLEIAAVHLLAWKFAPAWALAPIVGLLTPISALAVLYLAGLAKSVRLRPVLLTPRELTATSPALGTVTFAATDILAVRRVGPEGLADRRTPRTCLLDPANILVEGVGPTGRRRLALHVDEPDRLLATARALYRL